MEEKFGIKRNAVSTISGSLLAEPGKYDFHLHVNIDLCKSKLNHVNFMRFLLNLIRLICDALLEVETSY